MQVSVANRPDRRHSRSPQGVEMQVSVVNRPDRRHSRGPQGVDDKC